MQWGASQTCQETFCGRGKDVSLFQKGQIIGAHQAKKTGGWLRTVQHIKTWQDDGELHLQGQNNILNGRDGRSLKRLVKSAAELTAALDSESKSTPTQTMCKQLKGSGLNSCAALKNPLITEAYL